MVEGARLESVYTSKGYRGFESLTLRRPIIVPQSGAFCFGALPGLPEHKRKNKINERTIIGLLPTFKGSRQLIPPSQQIPAFGTNILGSFSIFNVEQHN